MLYHYQALNHIKPFCYHIDEDAHLGDIRRPPLVLLNMLSKARSLPVGLHSIISELKQKRIIDYVSKTDPRLTTVFFPTS